MEKQWAFISDIHVKSSEDDNYKLLLRFLDHEKARESNKIILLGDIFDLMVGYHPQYYVRFQLFFEKLAGLLNDGKEVYFFEGNHDLHLGKLFSDYFKANHISTHNFHYHEKGIIIKEKGVKYYISHGDDIELNNGGYQIYRKLVGSVIVRYIANYLMPLRLLEYFGLRASKSSKKRNQKRYDQPFNDEGVKLRFRAAARECFKKWGADVVICGHSHVKDRYDFEGKMYFNNGFASYEQTFFLLGKNGGEFVDLGAGNMGEFAGLDDL